MGGVIQAYITLALISLLESVRSADSTLMMVDIVGLGGSGGSFISRNGTYELEQDVQPTGLHAMYRLG